MVKTLIGYGVTDSNGVATLDHDSEGNPITGYTGVGDGHITIIASTDNPLTTSSTLSNRIKINDIATGISINLNISEYTITIGTTVTLQTTITEYGEPVIGETVTFKHDNVIIGTSRTNNQGIAVLNYTPNNFGSQIITAEYNNYTSNTRTLVINKITTQLSINVPQIIYSDEFNITGVLKDSNNIPLTGKDVKLYLKVGATTTLQATLSTDSNGEVNFHREAPTTITTYDFWIEYEGDTTYSNSTSSIETRTVGKETTVLDGYIPHAVIETSIEFTGSLVTNDNEPVANKTIKLTINNSVIGTTTTDSDGLIEHTFTGISGEGFTDLIFSFEGDEYYTASTKVINGYIEPSVDSISIVASPSVFMVGDTSVITGTALNSLNNPVSGASMSISINGSVVKTENTDSNGEVSYSYTGVGVGDVTVLVECMSVQETYSIEDLYYYNSGDHIDDLTVDSGVSISTDGSVITIGSSSGEKYVKLPTESITGDFRMETTIADSPNTTYNCAWICNSSTYGAINRTNASATIGGTGMGTISFDTSINGVLKLEYINGTLSVYFNNVLIGSKAINLASGYVGYFTNTGRTQKLKDIKFVYL